jgi:transposase-like protein
MRRIITYWLERPPTPTNDLSAVRYLILDGTFLEHRTGLFAVMDAERHAVVYAEPNTSEGPTASRHVCRMLAERAVVPKSATVDGNPHTIKALRHQWSSILIQRCLVHILRQGLSWCRRFPKRTDAKHLRLLFLQVLKIHTVEEQAQFLAEVQAWEQRYGQSIAQSPETGWVFSDLKRARSMLLAALPDMFHYLTDEQIPTSTNALEGYFARFKQRYRQHRGLAQRHRPAYFQWYVHLCPR